jgi:hypothetical protein
MDKTLKHTFQSVSSFFNLHFYSALNRVYIKNA